MAFEDDRVGHGLLTYSLCKDGQKSGAADFDPAEGKVTLGEWLRFGVRRVLEVAERIAAGDARGVNLGGRNLTPVDGKQKVAQQPSLFDFNKGEDKVLLSTSPKKK